MSASLNNEHIVCVALPSWEGDYMKSTVHLMSRLSKTNRVLYVDYPRTWMDAIRGALGKKTVPLRRMLGLESRLRKPECGEGEDIHVLTLPPVLPINALPHGKLYASLRKVNGWLMARSIRKAMRQLSFNQPIVVNAFQPGIGLELKGTLGEKSTIYYCYDEISEANWVGRHGAHEEKAYLEVVDTVVTTSDALWEAKERRANQCYVVKNGVDFPLFEQIGHLRVARLNGVQSSAPRIGFVGSIDARVDADLVVEMASRRPDWTFEFVGPHVDMSVVETLRTHDNIILTGPARPEELPAIMQHFDAGIIPFRKSEFTRFIYPIKVNEYLAAGLPVVMTDFARITDLEGAVGVADSTSAFVKALDKALTNDSAHIRQTRKSFASLNSWSVRAAQFSRIAAQQIEAIQIGERRAA